MFDDDERRYGDSGDEFDNDYHHNEDEPNLPDDESGTVACPHCGADVYEDAEYCPSCDTYITPDENAFANKPLWWLLLGIAGIVATLVALSGFLSW